MKAAIVGISGLILTPDEVALLREHKPAGVILFARNVADPAQVAALTAHIARVLPALALTMVDQEGGRVARLRPPHWLRHPPAAEIGALHDQDRPAGLRAAWLTGALIGMEAAAAGLDVVCAPVLDLFVPGADKVIGDRAYSADPADAGEIGAAMGAGLLAAGVQPVGKHCPGHGRATVDSHAGLPRLDTIADADLVPFARCAHLPWMMTAHIVYAGSDSAHPATQSKAIIEEVMRGRLGFEGVLVSDDLTMGALSGSPADRARAALEAGCDLALHCSGVLDETAEMLAGCPIVSDAGLNRMRTALFLAQRSRQLLDPSAMLAEREALLAQAAA